MENNPEISIICSVYNREKYIEQCVDSILNQTFPNFELILIDNGSTDSSVQIIDEYAKKDSRVIPIHNGSDSTYGKALNQGIKLAKGKYIGIVESDDFISPTMYERLYAQTTNFNADVCIAGFWVHIGNNNDENNIHNKQIFANVKDDELFSVFDYPFLLTVHQSIWAKLYKSEFLKSLKFDEEGKYIDSKFIIDVLCSTKKLIGLKEPVYYYRFDNPEASNSNLKNDVSLIKIIDDWEKARNALKEYGYYEKLKDEFYFLASKTTYRFFCNIAPKFKKDFFYKWASFIKELRNDSNYSFKYLDSEKIKFFKAGFMHNYNILNYDNYEVRYLFNIPINEQITKKEFVKTKYLFGLLKIIKTKKNKKIYCFGIRIKKKKYKNENIAQTISSLIAISQQNKVEIDNLRQRINYTSRLVYSSISNMQAISTHKEVFEKYRNCLNGQVAVLVGCAPSIDFYKPIENAIHVGVNRAFKKKHIKFDYLFAQDSFQEGMYEINKYPCKKFYGYLPTERIREVKDRVSRIRPIDYIESGASKYIIEDLAGGHWANDLTLEPIGDFSGTVFSALQFICFTNPKKLYIVACDCSAAVNKEIQVVNANLSYQIKAWKSFKQFVSETYPDMEIISVNPVGLKGIFSDVYTREYLFEHPEIKGDITILDYTEENNDF